MADVPLFPSVQASSRARARPDVHGREACEQDSVDRRSRRRYEGNRKAAAHALDSVLDTITREVAKGEKVAITGFGSFEKRVREARWVRNPQTGERIKAKKKAVPKFSAGAELKDVVSGAKKLPEADPAVAEPGGREGRGRRRGQGVPARAAPAATKTAAKKTTAKKSTREEVAGQEGYRQEVDRGQEVDRRRRPQQRRPTAKKSTAKKTATAKTSAAKKTRPRRRPRRRRRRQEARPRRSPRRRRPPRSRRPRSPAEARGRTRPRSPHRETGDHRGRARPQPEGLRGREVGEVVDVAAQRRQQPADLDGPGVEVRRARVRAVARVGKTLYTALYDVVDPRYGPDSRAAHLDAGAVEVGGLLASLRRDVDDLADLAAAQALGLGPCTAAVVAGLAMR